MYLKVCQEVIAPMEPHAHIEEVGLKSPQFEEFLAATLFFAVVLLDDAFCHVSKQ
ncbi:hypothetical protein [Streptomyces sp. TLI_105]|uniref:hypothetical protein n=1 Tax=Streptomyces sp. TLI_105 TaxID=1881019 RepID=UPI0015A5DF55|nr:hypothetical protein [Streptomyces sp. TLI_105]